MKVRNITVDKRPVHYIGRPSIYGNPFRLQSENDRDFVLLQFIDYWYAPEQKWLREKALRELVTFDLGCFCTPKRCHGDIIAGYLNWKKQPT